MLEKRLFKAIRIEVNGELDRLAKTLEFFLVDKLKKAEELQLLTFHSLEDRIVKTNFFMKLEKSCTCPPKTPICICGGKQIVKFVNKNQLLQLSKELLNNVRSSKT